MFNSGFESSIIDGTELKYENEKIQIPLEFSYMKNLPPVLNQGDDSICVPCAISAWCEYKLSLLSGLKQNSKFRLFDIFNSRTTRGDGMTCKEAFEYVIAKGAKYKNGIIHANAYYNIASVYSLKNAILNNGPCIAALPVYNVDDIEFWKNTEDLKGYHAVAVVGYDNNGFIIRNSWGDSYGFNGYSHISFEDMKKAKELWTLV